MMFHMRNKHHMRVPSMVYDCRIRKAVTVMAAGFVLVQAARVLCRELSD